MGKYKVLTADDKCMLGSKHAPYQPMIVDEDYNVNWLFTDYLAYRRKYKGSEEVTVALNANQLVRVLNYLHQTRNFSLSSLVNDDLEGYIDQSEDNQSFRTSDVNRLVNALHWAQERGYLPFTICGANDLEKGKFYPVTVKYTKNGYAKSDFKRTERKQHRIELASEDDIEAIFEGIADRYEAVPYDKRRDWFEDICERDILMLSLQLDAGLRGIEVSKLKIKHLPSRESNLEAVQNETMQEILIEDSKGQKTRHVSVSAVLIMQLYEYIDHSRPNLLSNRKVNRGHDFRDLGYIFPSMQDGQMITTRQLYNIVSKDAPRVSPQVLRRNGLTNITKRAIELLRQTRGIDYTDEDVLIHAASQAGHEKPSTTQKHYVKMHRIYEADLEKDNSTPHALKAKMRMIEKENQRLREENRSLKTKAYKK